MVFGKGLVLLSANRGRFEINELLFADDTALVADSEEKLCRMVSEFGRVEVVVEGETFRSISSQTGRKWPADFRSITTA